MKIAPIFGAIALCLPAFTQADTIGFEIGSSVWNQNYAGTVQSGPNSIDVEQTLGLQDETDKSFYLLIEHPIPLIPNFLFAKTEISVEETGTINVGFNFDGAEFTEDALVTTDSDLSYTDLTLYYELLDNWINFDAGITVRQFDGGITLTGNGLTAREKFDDILPMLYLAAKFDLPLTGLYIGGDMNTLSYNGDALVDYKLNIGYETSFGLGLEAGWRSFDLDFADSSDEKIDTAIDGGYASIFYHF